MSASKVSELLVAQIFVQLEKLRQEEEPMVSRTPLSVVEPENQGSNGGGIP